jgi:uncharacterized protein
MYVKPMIWPVVFEPGAGNYDFMTNQSHWQHIFRTWLLGEAEGDPAHDAQHIERVVANAQKLAGTEGADLDILIPAAWLHDCVHVPKDSPDRARASGLAADHALTLLAGWDYPAQHFPAIHHAIEAHSFSANIPTQTTEAKVLQDADRLDALGAIGLSRCLMLGGFMGSKLFHPDDPFCEARTPDDKHFAVDHFYAKLFTLAGTMKTDAGRALAEERTEILRLFLDALRSEIPRGA